MIYFCKCWPISLRLKAQQICSSKLKKKPYLDSLRVEHENSLEDLGQIAEIERVVTFGGCGQKLPHDGLVDEDTAVNHIHADHADLLVVV